MPVIFIPLIPLIPRETLKLPADWVSPGAAGVAAGEFFQRVPRFGKPAGPPQQRPKQQLRLAVSRGDGQQRPQFRFRGQPVSGEVGVAGIDEKLLGGGVAAACQGWRES